MNAKQQLSCACLALAALLGLSAGAPAAEIVGKVVLSGEAAADVVISIEGLKLDGPLNGKVYGIDHRNLNFIPHVLVVRAGSTVQFKNSDGMPCHIYSISPAGLFVLRRQDNKPMTITFDRPGIIEIRCADHRQIYAYVITKENPYFAVTDPQGRFKITKVPPGRYTLQAWYEGKVIDRIAVEVRTAKLKINLQASRPLPKARDEQPAGDRPLPPIADFVTAVSPDLLAPWRKEK